MRTSSADRRGRTGELIAVWLLRLKGFTILERRLATPCGEIDIVARRGDLLVFVEVKRRPAASEALAALGAEQRARITRAAEAYLRRRPGLLGLACRFDLVAIGAGGWPVHVADAWRG